MRYKLFGPTGLRVSEVALGTGTFGTRWGSGAEKTESKRIFDAFAEAGGTFIDTADIYQFGQSEEFLADFLKADRDHFVVGTKYTLNGDDLSKSGNNRKNMLRALDASLKRLGTDFVDVYWLHIPDGVTPIEEIVRGLDDLVRSGRVHYIGLSDFPAWRTAQGATLADLRGLVPLAAVQIEYSLIERTPERELLPMSRDFGLAFAAWSPLAGGVLTGKYLGGATEGRKTQGGGPIQPENERTNRIVEAVVDVAAEHGTTPSQVALAWLRQQEGAIIPILGARTLTQLEDNLGALDLTLSEEALARLDRVSAVPLGFPHEMLRSAFSRASVTGGKYDLIDLPQGARALASR